MRICPICEANSVQKQSRFCNACRRLCSRCRQDLKAQRSSYCNGCQRDLAKVYKIPYEEWPEARKKKHRCRSYAQYYIKTGLLVKGPCAVDGCEQPSEMHHPDYDRPLKVVWLCRKHHRRLHQDFDPSS